MDQLNPDLVYSLTLLLAMLAGSVALLAAIQRRLHQHNLKLLCHLDGLVSNRSWFWTCISIGSVSLLFSLWVHMVLGHGVASVEPVTGLAFFGIHPSYLLIGMMLVAAGFLGRRGN